MPVLNRAAELQDEITTWRRNLHREPEVGFEVHKTAAFVAEKLNEFGCDEVVTGIGRTGVVAVIKGRLGEGPAIGLRADMDALPIRETSGVPHASTVPGKMHACGHDGHTAMLLGAGKYLAETRNFRGSVVLIFQPAEEGGGGGREMVNDGLMERFGIERVFGMHNMPGLPVGQFAMRPGAIMAATAEFSIRIRGKGTHAAMPHRGIDPIVTGSQLVIALQAIASRTIDPADPVVVSVTKFNGGEAHNVIADEVLLGGTVRTLKQEVAAQVETRMRDICEGIGRTCGASVTMEFIPNYPLTVNDADEAIFAGDIAASVAGESGVHRDVPPLMGGEDFSYMLNARPGAFIFIGNGETQNLHHPAYDFNDEAIPFGVSYWVKLAETALAA